MPTISKDDLFRAILAMDIYHRDYNAGIKKSYFSSQTQIGNATLRRSSGTDNGELIDGVEHEASYACGPDVNLMRSAMASTAISGGTVNRDKAPKRRRLFSTSPICRPKSEHKRPEFGTTNSPDSQVANLFSILTSAIDIGGSDSNTVKAKNQIGNPRTRFIVEFSLLSYH